MGCLPWRRALAVTQLCIHWLPTQHWLPPSRLAAPNTVLLYGPQGCGKTMLSMAVAHQAGATLLDLSPAVTAGKYSGKEAGTMVHMVSWVCGPSRPPAEAACSLLF